MTYTNKIFQFAQFNFRDKQIVQKAFSDLPFDENDTIVEIGPGQGLITEIILKKAKVCLAFEIDKSLAPQLNKMVENNTNLKIVWGDFLSSSLPNYPYKIVSNIPFNLTRPILEKIITHLILPDLIILVMQTEVCEKIARKQNENTLLSAFIGTFYQAKILNNFDRKDFQPPAHVNVSLLQMKQINNTENFDRKKYLDFLTTIFENPGQNTKQRLKKLFTYPQIKRLTLELKLPVNEAPYKLSSEQFKKLFLLHQKLNTSI